VAKQGPDVFASVSKVEDVVVPKAVPTEAREESPGRSVLPADRPDVRLDLRIPDALEALELSDWVPGYRRDHAIPSMVGLLK
jgi:hypothetical protein